MSSALSVFDYLDCSLELSKITVHITCLMFAALLLLSTFITLTNSLHIFFQGKSVQSLSRNRI